MLLIIDNVENPKDDRLFSLANYLNCKLLITSRCDGYKNLKRISVPSLSGDYCKKLFEYYSTIERNDDIINKINNNSSDVTVLSDNHYSVKIDYESGDMSYSDVYADVYVTDGYVSKLSYDLTSMFASEGFTKFTIDIQITDFNAAGDVTIPENIKKEASSV